MASFLFPEFSHHRHKLKPLHDLQRETVNKVKSST